MVMNAEQAIAGRRAAHRDHADACAAGDDHRGATVRDTGTGIPADVLSRIFEPFFTTKEVGKGHGARPGDRLRNRAGARRADLAANHPDGGAVFTVELPSPSRRRSRWTLIEMIDETFLTTEEVLEYLQVNLRTVYRLIKAGKIPGGPRRPAVAVPQARHRRLARQPAPRGARAPAPAPRAARAGAPPPRVLVVDDEASIRDLLSKTLALAEYDVDIAPDGRSALERLRMYPYDLLIADLKMPGMDGLTVIREAKRLKADLPVIIITGFSTESSAIEAVNLGVAGYLTKPFRVPQVLAAAAKALGEGAYRCRLAVAG